MGRHSLYYGTCFVLVLVLALLPLNGNCDIELDEWFEKQKEKFRVFERDYGDNDDDDGL